MNYYPYYTSIPYVTKPSLFGGLFKGIKFSSILNGTQKTLNVVNQAIPLIKQAKPLVDNAKTMFNIMNEFKKTDNPIVETKEVVNKTFNDGPTFFQ